MKVALVTGGSSGIGKAVVTRLSQMRYRVVACSRNKQSLEQLQNELSGQGHPIHIHPIDLQIEESITTCFSDTYQKLGPLNLLINCAGIGYDEPLIDGSATRWRTMVEINILGLCMCTKEALLYMSDSEDYDHIINISSLSGHRVGPDGGLYSATKFAVTAITETLRRELVACNRKIKVSQISPGLVETNFHKNYYGSDETADALYQNFAPLDADNIADAVSYLISQPNNVHINDILLRPVKQPL